VLVLHFALQSFLGIGNSTSCPQGLFLKLEILHFASQTYFAIGNFTFSPNFFSIVTCACNSLKSWLELAILYFAPQTFLEIVNFASQTYFGIDNFTFFFPIFFGTVNFAFCSSNVCLK
jgi:hypothetical protein